MRAETFFSRAAAALFACILILLSFLAIVAVRSHFDEKTDKTSYHSTKEETMTNRPQINIRIKDENKAYLESWADREKRSLSNLLNLIIENAIDKDKS